MASEVLAPPTRPLPPSKRLAGLPFFSRSLPDSPSPKLTKVELSGGSNAKSLVFVLLFAF